MISSPNTDKVYIGSTIQALTARFRCHKSVCNTTRSSIIIAAGDAKITELYKFETWSIKELRAKELEYILQYKDKLVNIYGTKGYTGLSSKEAHKKRDEEEGKVSCMYCGTLIYKRNMKRHIKMQQHELKPEFENIKLNGKECSIA